MLPDQVSNPGPLTYESGALPIALRGPAKFQVASHLQCKERGMLLSNYKWDVDIDLLP